MSQQSSNKGSEKPAVTSFGISRRTLGDEPSIGKVAKSGRGNPPSKESLRKEAENESRAKARSNIILIRWGIVVFIVATAVILALTMNLMKTQREEGVLTQKKINTSVSDDQSQKPIDPKLLPPEPEELEKRASAFLKSNNEQDLLTHIRSSQIPEAEMFTRFQEVSKKAGEVQKVSYLGPADSRLFRAESVLVKYTGRGNRMISFVRGEDGSWKIDLDAFLRYNTLAIDTLLDGGDHEGVFRLFASRGNYYNEAYSDESRWQAITLGSPDHETLLMGYVEKKSPASDALIQMFNKSKGFASSGKKSASKPLQVTVKLAHHKGNEARQVEITDVVSDGWVIPDAVTPSSAE